MSYARFRLWMGISAVGSLVAWVAVALILDWPETWLSNTTDFQAADGLQLAGLFGLASLWLLPFDLVGGYWGPRRFGRSSLSFSRWCFDYLAMASLQTSYFILVGLILLTAGRFGGSPAVLMTVTGLVGISGQMSALILLKRSTPSEHVLPQLGAARDLAASWGVRLPRVLVVNHTDPGFTGGITRLGWQLTIVVPRLWVQQLSSEGLACILARRALAIESGGYARGVAVAMSWILSGVALATLLPGGGFTTVAQVATSFGYFTLWSFLGLLWMPSWSRQAILELDRRLLQRDVPADLLQRTAHQLDRWQDDEPHRSAWLESVFHPIPAANNRGRTGGETGWLIWNPARQTLIASWGCAGLLARAVHCNLGRPELWLMLPSD